MQNLPNFEISGKRAFYRPEGKLSFEQAVDLVARAMKAARDAGCIDMLANVCGLSGFASPTTTSRYVMAQRWAENSGTQLRVALVVRPEHMDPQKIGVLMAQNRGASGDVFLNEVSALAWLDLRHDSRT
jgi:hypothetical protein